MSESKSVVSVGKLCRLCYIISTDDLNDVNVRGMALPMTLKNFRSFSHAKSLYTLSFCKCVSVSVCIRAWILFHHDFGAAREVEQQSAYKALKKAAS